MTTLVWKVRAATLHWPRLAWWQWAKIASIVLLVAVAALAGAGVSIPRLGWALAVHWFLDFGVQSTPTALGKARRDWKVLVCHGFLTGGFPGLIAGGLVGLVISALLHGYVDSLRKFGLSDWRGIVLDQAAHVVTLIALGV